MTSIHKTTPEETASRSFQVIPVTTPIQQEWFLDVPAIVYANDPNWVPPLRSSIAKQLAPTNPFRQYGMLQQFIVLRPSSGKTPALLGRIVAAVNRRLCDREGENVGIFGYFECVNDFVVAKALLDTACDWLRQQGMTKVRGPINLFTHNSCLFLVDGFDTPPRVMMPYNPPYYPQFVERDGWQKAKDAYAYDLDLGKPLPQEFERAYRVASRSGISFRPLCLKGQGFETDCRNLHRLFVTLFADNYSATPHTEQEFLEESQDLRSLIDPDACPIAEDNGEMVGFLFSLPDYNMPLQHVNGKLNLLGKLKFLWYRRKIDQARVLIVCSLPQYRRKMVPLALVYLGVQGAIKTGKLYKRAELGHVYEDNMPSRKLIEAMGATIYKTYRIYEKELSESS